jgi:RHS repeat-associated protein
MEDYYPFGLTFNSYSRENSAPQDYKYNGKEEQTELNLGWLDYGQRMYQPELGRFFAQDRFAEKYYDHSPYGYALNNPALYIDINGDSVWTTHASNVDKNGNTTVTHTVHVQGKVLNQSNGSTKAGDVARGLNGRLNAQGSTSTKTNDNGTTTTEIINFAADFTEAKSMADVSKTDHLVVMVDGVLGKGDPSLGGGDAVGLGSEPGKISYVESSGAVETAFHEVGHNLGLPHSKGADPMSYSGRGTNFSRDQVNMIYENAISGSPNNGSNSGVMGNHFPNVPSGSVYGTSNNTRPFKTAPGQRALIPLPLINKH